MCCPWTDPPSTCKTEHAVEGVAGLAPQARTPLKVLLGRQVAFFVRRIVLGFPRDGRGPDGDVYMYRKYSTSHLYQSPGVAPTPILAMQDCCWSAPASWT